MRKPYKLIREIQPTEFKSLSLPRRAIPKIYLVNQRRGRAYLGKDFVTIPQRAETAGKGYLLYYITHELSHILSKSAYHDFAFYKMFMQICPEKLQHHELKYKPTAVKFGIKNISSKRLAKLHNSVYDSSGRI